MVCQACGDFFDPEDEDEEDAFPMEEDDNENAPPGRDLIEVHIRVNIREKVLPERKLLEFQNVAGDGNRLAAALLEAMMMSGNDTRLNQEQLRQRLVKFLKTGEDRFGNIVLHPLPERTAFFNSPLSCKNFLGLGRTFKKWAKDIVRPRKWLGKAELLIFAIMEGVRLITISNGHQFWISDTDVDIAACGLRREQQLVLMARKQTMDRLAREVHRSVIIGDTINSGADWWTRRR